MRRRSTHEDTELVQRFTPSTSQLNKSNQTKIALPGLPRQCHRLWKSDYLATVCCLLCFATAVCTVFHPVMAVWLGQVNQLISLGILLQSMAMCTQKQLQHLFLAAECLWNKSPLQNYESIIRANFLAANTSILLRLAIFTYLSFPIALGLAYKGFTGGQTVSAPELGSGEFG